MAIEPRDAWRETFEPVIPRRRTIGQKRRSRVLPRTDDEPRAGRDVAARPPANPHEVIELAWQKWIEPAGSEEHRPLQRARAIIAVDGAPVRVFFWMIHPIVEERDVLRGAIVRLDERKAVVAALEHRVRRRLVVGATAADRPEQGARERKRAARIEHAVEIGAADLHHERRPSPWRSWRGVGDGPLR